jgi:hypothetical protein
MAEKLLADDRLKWVTMALCAYEITAIVTHKVPTITALQKRYKWVGKALIHTMKIHFDVAQD